MVDKTDVENWLKTKMPNLSCPCCQGSLLGAQPFMYEQPRFFDPSGIMSGTGFNMVPSEPKLTLWEKPMIGLQFDDDTKLINYLGGIIMIILVCNNCGYVMPFDAKKMGLID